ncbi:MAG: hypothetical protein Q4F67_03930 [Propionibacteriaceae bacterium]|nr:hypothetical protein [Propionibacteriaceae bacterium]
MTEDRLRAALREGLPQPMDAQAIAANARRRRALGLARIGVAAAALTLVGSVGVYMVGRSATETVRDPASAGATETVAPAAEAAPTVMDSNSDIIPGRVLDLKPDRWCLVGSSDHREVGCAARGERVQRITDDRGEQWLVVLADSGPETAVLQVEQRAAWVHLRSVAAPGNRDLWLGVLPSNEAPESPRGLRALNKDGREIWRD